MLPLELVGQAKKVRLAGTTYTPPEPAVFPASVFGSSSGVIFEARNFASVTRTDFTLKSSEKDQPVSS